MSMTAVEKVLARTAGKSSVRPGDVVYPDPDFIMIHDGLVRGAKRELDSLGIDRPANAGRFGSKEAKLYLGSPATVADSAVAGAITDPRVIPVMKSRSNFGAGSS